MQKFLSQLWKTNLNLNVFSMSSQRNKIRLKSLKNMFRTFETKSNELSISKSYLNLKHRLYRLQIKISLFRNRFLV